MKEPSFTVHHEVDLRKTFPAWTSHMQVELLWIERGSMRLMLDNRSFPAETGDLLVIPPNKLHQLIFDGDGSFSTICLMIQASMKNELENAGFSGTLSFLGEAMERPILHPLDGQAEWMRLLFLQLEREKTAALPMSDNALVCLLGLTLIEVERLYDKPAPAEVEEVYDLPEISRIIKNVIQYIDRHYQEDIGLARIAQEFWLSPSYLSRQFKSNVGQNLTEFITLRRMRCAREMLRTGEKSVSEVAMEAGFNNVSYFNAVFKKLMGVTPSEYRRTGAKKERGISYEG